MYNNENEDLQLQVNKQISKNDVLAFKNNESKFMNETF
jgi:hypothetical protein